MSDLSTIIEQARDLRETMCDGDRDRILDLADLTDREKLAVKVAADTFAHGLDPIIRDLEALRDEQGWRPIETAPVTTRSVDAQAVLVVKDYDYGPTVTIGLLDHWMQMNGYTHWMPLPAPPQEEQHHSNDAYQGPEPGGNWRE